MQAAQCLRDIGLALMRLSRPLEALEQLRSAAALAPRLPHLYSNLGLTLQALGRMQEAAEALQTAVEVDGAGQCQRTRRAGSAACILWPVERRSEASQDGAAHRAHARKRRETLGRPGRAVEKNEVERPIRTNERAVETKPRNN
mmetsp:Transcript_39198/g.65869  ORF Transcript_39198/g.65869 Transcript_39198/m.65869 type:complete len:144 (+) Transcript_39198:251-682(+)